jgi:proteasome lid subunit RPN8/RPN11
MRPPHVDDAVAGAEPLASVALVCREASPQVGAIRALVWLIDAFVAVDSRWTTASVCAANAPGMLRLLPRVAALEPCSMDPLYKRKLFADAVESAAQIGDLAVLQWLVDVYLPTGRLRGVDEVAARHGHLHILRWLLRHRGERVVRSGTPTQLLRRAAKGNHLETCQWLHDHDSKSSLINNSTKKYLLGCAMRHGNVEMAAWLSPLEPAAVKMLLPRAIKSGSLRMIQWAISHVEGEGCTESSMTLAVAGGHLQLAQWLQPTYPHVSARSLLKAAAHGHFNMITWALRSSIVDNSDTLSSAIDYAAANGRLDTVQLLHTTSRGRCSTTAMDGAAKAGHLEIIKWLHDNRNEGCSTLAMDGAATHGHLPVVKWLHNHQSEGCTAAAMDGAAQNDHLDVVKWLHEHRTEGCTASGMDRAAALGHLAVVAWLHENRSEGCTTMAMDSAAANGHLDVVMWLHTHRSEGCTVKAMDQAAFSNHLDVIEWLDIHRSEGCSNIALCEATSLGHLAVVKWLVGHRSVLAPSERALVLAVERGHFEVILTLEAAGKFECPIESFNSALQWRNFEIFQWLVREHSDQFPGLLDSIGASSKAYADDCLEELAALRA